MVTNMCLSISSLAPLRNAVLAVLVALTCAASPAAADDLADFNVAVERAMSHHRVALGYLRTGNIDLATLELEAMREAWGKVTALPRPAALQGNELYGATLLDVSTRIIGVFLVLDMGRDDVARTSLATIRQDLAAMRRASKVEVLADCVLDANNAMDTFFVLRDKPPTWTDASDAPGVAAKANSYRDALQRCDAMAPARIKQDAEFRRLIDGALASLAQVPKAIETRDNDLLHRLLIELRSFDRLLAFRYG